MASKGTGLSKHPCKTCGNPSYFTWDGCPVCRAMRAKSTVSRGEYKMLSPAWRKWEARTRKAQEMLALAVEGETVR